MTALEQAVKETLSLMAPPTELTVSQWADKYRMLSPESSAQPGPWDNSTAPYQIGMMDAFTDPEITELVIQSSSQIGKTDILLNMIGYVIDKDPGPTMLVLPTDRLCISYSKKRLAPMIRDTPTLKAKVSEVKSRDSDNTTQEKAFPGGGIVLVGSNSPSNLASRPIRYLFLDEVDRFEMSSGSEGDPVDLAEMRTSTFWNKKIVKVSTPGNDETSRISVAFKESDQRYYYVPCLKCSKKWVLAWADVVWDKDDKGEHLPETARVKCPSCGNLHSDDDLPDMLEAGEWKTHNPGSIKSGFHLNELYSPWVKLETTVRKFLEAKNIRSRERLKVWTNTRMGETWRETGASVKNDELQHRAEEYGEVEVPEDVLVLTAAIDVQDDRLEMECIGWGSGFESWGIEYHIILGDPDKRQVWDQALEWLNRPRKRASGLEMRVISACVDSGGHHTKQVYKFCQPLEGRRVFAIKGRGGENIPFLSRPSRNNTYNCALYSLGVDEAKSNLLANLRLLEPGPNYCHFPRGRGYDADYFKQLTSEEKLVKYVKGVPTYYWRLKKGHTRNEALDIRVYNLAAVELLNPDFKALRENLDLRELRHEGKALSAEVSGGIQKRVKQRRGGFVKRF